MHSMDFYVSTCRCVMQADSNNPESWSELYRLLPCLRQSLTCYVCTKIILDPMGPTHNVCKHTVCKKCIGGKMKLKPSCSWCKDHSTFHENILQKILVSCFIKLCVYIYHSPIGQHLCNISVNGETNSLASILKEGIDFTDNYESSAGHPINLPPVNCVDAEKSPVAGSSKYDNEFNEMKEEAQKQVSATTMFPEECEAASHADVKRNTALANSRRQARAASTKKAVVFIKRAAQNRRKTMKLKNLMNQKSRNRGKSKGRKVLAKSDSLRPRTVSFNTNSNSSEYLGEPALERVEIDEPVPKRIKQELQPPELKPPSFCRCGKAGTSNQLTCLGQRCPCYSMKLPCIGCKCKGCRNPKKGPTTEQDKYGSAVVLRSSTIYRAQSEGLCVNM